MTGNYPKCECHDCTQERVRVRKMIESGPNLATPVIRATLMERERAAKIAEEWPLDLHCNCTGCTARKEIAAKIRGGQ